MAWLMVATLFLSFNAVRVTAESTGSSTSTTVDISNLAFELQGFTTQGFFHNNYTGFVEWLGSTNTPYYNNYLYNGPPKNFGLVEYNYTLNGQVVFMEIYGYANEQNATSEYKAQASAHVNVLGGENPCGNIFYRFPAHFYPAVLFHRGQFMMFAWIPDVNTGTVAQAWGVQRNCIQEFVDNVFQVLPREPLSPPPPPSSSGGPVVWGVQPGDTISWKVAGLSSSGNLLEGFGGNTDDSCNIWMKIVRFSNDNSSILIQENAQGSSVSDPDFAFLAGWTDPTDPDVPARYNNFVLELHLDYPPYYTYFWANATTPIFDPAHHSPVPLIFPLYNGTDDLKSTITKETLITGENLIEGNGYLGGHYSTSAHYQTHTRIEDITVHEGSGITTYGLWYDNDEVNSFMKSDNLTLVSTSFDLSSRPAPTSPPNPTPTSPSNPTPLNATQTSFNEAVGGIVFLVIVIALVAVVALFVRRRKGAVSRFPPRQPPSPQPA